jgi:outer membrane receptor protein involved in Fe transport
MTFPTSPLTTARLHLLSPRILRATGLFLAIHTLFHAPAQAQNAPESTSSSDASLAPVTVKGQRLLDQSSAFSATTITAQEIRSDAVSNPQELFRRVPGVVIRNFGLGGVADGISMRGFGSGSHGGDIGLVLDGITLNEAFSHSDGYSDFNAIIPLELSRLDVFRGPSSVLHGNYNRAGAMFFQTRKGGNYTLGDASVGSFSTFDTQVAVGREQGGKGAGSSAINLAAQLYGTQGFRSRDSEFDKQTLSGRYAYRLTDASEIAVSARLHRSEGRSGAYLTAPQFAVDPRGVDPRVIGDGAKKDFSTLRLDFNTLINSEIKLLTYVYGTAQEFNRYFTRPVTSVPTAPWAQRDERYDRQVRGFGASLNGTQSVFAGKRLNWVAGVESLNEQTQYQFFDNLINRVPTAGPVANRTFDYTVRSVFAEGELSLSPLFRPTVGVRHDSFSGSCRVGGPESLVDAAGGVQGACNTSLNATSRASPKLGFRSTLAPGVDLRGNYSEGFQLGNLRALFSPNGANVQPNVFKQRELGMTYTGIAGLRLDVTAFDIRSVNEIREIPAASNQFVNSGEATRKGTEVSLAYSPATFWDVGLNHATVRTEITANPSASLIGRELTNIPRSNTNLFVAYAPSQGLGARLDARHVGAYAVSADNTVRAPSYGTLDFSLSYRGKVGQRQFRAYLAANNLADRTYATSTFLIAGQRLFAPAAGRNFSIGVQADL